MTIALGLAVAYLIPWSRLPDVIDLDELETGQRREEIFLKLAERKRNSS